MDLIRNGPGSLIDAYRDASVIVGTAVRIYPEGVNEDTPIAEWPAPLAAGVITAIERDLTLRIRGHPDPITRGRLAFESAF